MSNKNTANYSIGVIHPETGEKGNLISCAELALVHLSKKCTTDGKKLTGTFALQKELELIGLRSSLPHFGLFLQQIGLIRKLNKVSVETGGMSYKYLALDPNYFHAVVNQESVNSVLREMKERQDMQRMISSLEKKVKKEAVIICLLLLLKYL